MTLNIHAVAYIDPEQDLLHPDCLHLVYVKAGRGGVLPEKLGRSVKLVRITKVSVTRLLCSALVRQVDFNYLWTTLLLAVKNEISRLCPLFPMVSLVVFYPG